MSYVQVERHRCALTQARSSLFRQFAANMPPAADRGRSHSKVMFNHQSLSQGEEATVGNMNYEMIRECKMEINPSDYSAQYPTIQFFI